jgi:sirohydrochlorin ferrochelatase
MEDIPAEVALAQQHFGDEIAIAQQPHLGAHPEVGQLLTDRQAIARADAKILISHGTRRPGGNEPVEAIAQQLGAVAAYWSVSPNLEEQVKASIAQGCKQLAILPYFIFAGGITDAIAQQVTELQGQFPEATLMLGNPIGASDRLAELIVDLTEKP